MLFWLYIKDTCDHAGIWKPNKKIFEFLIEEKIDLEKALEYFNDQKERVIVLKNGDWLLADFFFFQYGQTMNLANRVHKSVYDRYKELEVNLRSIRGLIDLKEGIKDKDKEKDNNALKAIQEEIPTDIQQMFIRTLGRNPKLPEVEETEKLINQYGRENVHRVLKTAALRGINSFDYLQTQLEVINGKLNLRPYNGNGKQSTPRRELNEL
ncbi:hypothetical protein ASZ90_003446 [hydrocarbon metagenome]|uniref:Uncharacterized protein n=1 Tax=hydrocarbon metagenome TaxID=938273 RepID=A0A0W8G0U2_9ZZZZ